MYIEKCQYFKKYIAGHGEYLPTCELPNHNNGPYRTPICDNCTIGAMYINERKINSEKILNDARKIPMRS